VLWVVIISHTHTQAHTHAHMHTHIHTRTHTHTHTHAHTHAHTHTHTHTHTRAHTHTRPHAHRTQEDALQPFVALLRACDAPHVREAAIAHVHHLVAHGGCPPGSFSSRPHSSAYAPPFSPHPWTVASRCDGVLRLQVRVSVRVNVHA